MENRPPLPDIYTQFRSKTLPVLPAPASVGMFLPAPSEIPNPTLSNTQEAIPQNWLDKRSTRLIEKLASVPVITTESLDWVIRVIPWEQSASQIQRYEMQAQLQPGGLGDVFIATDTLTNETVCIKKIKKNIPNNPKAKQRFIREGVLLMVLDHPNIVKGRNLFEHNDEIYLVMDYIEGKSLHNKIFTEPNPATPQETAEVLTDVIGALTYLHNRGVIFRDVKPENIMSGKKNTLIDLGISSVVVPDDPDILVGTEGYTTFDTKDDETKDVLALGVLMYVMFTKEPLYKRSDILLSMLTVQERNSFFSRMAKLTKELTTAGYSHGKLIPLVIEKATMPQQKDRYQTAQALLDAYNVALELMTSAQPETDENLIFSQSNPDLKPSGTFILDWGGDTRSLPSQSSAD